jgi:hypothetical protein
MLRVRINWTGITQGYSVWHFLPGEDSSTTAESAADAATAWLTTINTYLSGAQVATVDPEVLQVDVGTGNVEGVFATSQSPVTGTSGANVIPNAANALVRWRTGVFTAGRELRGRTFIPGMTEDENDQFGNLDPAVVTGINAANVTLLGTTDFAIWSPTLGSAATVTSGTTWGEWAVLRSRRD